MMDQRMFSTFWFTTICCAKEMGISRGQFSSTVSFDISRPNLTPESISLRQRMLPHAVLSSHFFSLYLNISFSSFSDSSGTAVSSFTTLYCMVLHCLAILVFAFMSALWPCSSCTTAPMPGKSCCVQRCRVIISFCPNLCLA